MIYEKIYFIFGMLCGFGIGFFVSTIIYYFRLKKLEQKLLTKK